jgi:hypothetical protein
MLVRSTSRRSKKIQHCDKNNFTFSSRPVPHAAPAHKREKGFFIQNVNLDVQNDSCAAHKNPLTLA